MITGITKRHSCIMATRRKTMTDEEDEGGEGNMDIGDNDNKINNTIYTLPDGTVIDLSYHEKKNKKSTTTTKTTTMPTNPHATYTNCTLPTICRTSQIILRIITLRQY